MKIIVQKVYHKENMIKIPEQVVPESELGKIATTLLPVKNEFNYWDRKIKEYCCKELRNSEFFHISTVFEKEESEVPRCYFGPASLEDKYSGRSFEKTIINYCPFCGKKFEIKIEKSIHEIGGRTYD